MKISPELAAASVALADVDTSMLTSVTLVSTITGLAVYVWMALALAAVFRKMGEEPWRAWVPLLNVATFLRVGGLSPWLALVALVPGLGAIALLALIGIAAHRTNPAFGYGTGMTVLAVVLFPVWASIVGFGPARWLGARPAGAPVLAPAPQPSAAETSASTATVIAPVTPGGFAPIAPESTASSSDAADTVAAGGFVVTPPPSASPFDAPGSFEMPAVAAPATMWAPPELPQAPSPTPTEPYAWRDGAGAADAALAPHYAVVPAPPVPGTPPASAPASVSPTGWAADLDEVSAVSPAPFPPSAASAPGRPSIPAPPIDGPISFVPGRTSGAPVTPEPAPQMPAAVTRAPAAWNPAPETTRSRRPMAQTDDPDAFPELSGEVSAVVGAPAAGTPRSAMQSVSAQQRGDQAFDDLDEDMDHTVIAKRKRPTWELQGPSGQTVALTADVVILGRAPSADPAHATAQLVPIIDESRTVSKTHARLERHGEGWMVTDLHSTNGVLIPTVLGTESEVEAGVAVPAGDRFFLGDAEVRLTRNDG